MFDTFFRDMGTVPAILGFAVLALIAYSIVKGGKGSGKGSSGSSSSSSGSSTSSTPPTPPAS